MEKRRDQVSAQKMWGGENLQSSHINGSVKNECFAVQGAFHMHEEPLVVEELLEELLSSPLRIHMRRRAGLQSMESRSRKCSLA